MLKSLEHFGRYLLLLAQLPVRRERIQVYYADTLVQAVNIGIGSLPIILIASVFIGSVMAINTAYQLTSGLFPDSLIGTVTSSISILEFSSTVMALLLAGRVGSNMASEIGTMRVYEQVDALQVMGVNAPSYLIAPKILGAIFTFPLLTVISAFVMHLGGIAAGELTGIVNIYDFKTGAQETYDEFSLYFMLIKSAVYAFLIASISCYQGFYVKGGPREVGAASTRAVVVSSIMILFADLVLARLFLTQE